MRPQSYTPAPRGRASARAPAPTLALAGACFCINAQSCLAQASVQIPTRGASMSCPAKDTSRQPTSNVASGRAPPTPLHRPLLRSLSLCPPIRLDSPAPRSPSADSIGSEDYTGERLSDLLCVLEQVADDLSAAARQLVSLSRGESLPQPLVRTASSTTPQVNFQTFPVKPSSTSHPSS